jgi:adenylylsulfate kinase
MKHIYPLFDKTIQRHEKEKKLNQKAKVIWFTGLSGSGKTTLATALENYLFEKGFMTQILDGDNIRSGINNNLGFSHDDRKENIRRIAEIARLFLNCGIIGICSFISPTEEVRKIARNIIGEDDFFEIYLSTPIQVCEERDVKGLYKKARAGEIKNFTGITAPFEIPQNARLTIDTSNLSVNKAIDIIFNKINNGITYTK